IYPITPSSPMAESCDEWQSKGVKNLFGEKLLISELQSEAGVAGALHGALSAGSLATTFTSSQGLLLMIPNMYKIAGELLPCVFHVSARALSTHALSIFGDHADVMSCRGTGFAMLCSNNVQETQDLAVVAHLATLKSSVPFMHFFDGFRTSHEIQKIEKISNEDLKKILPKNEINEFKNRALSSTSPHAQGTAQNPDIYFQNRESSNSFYDNAILAVKSSMNDLFKITGRQYNLFDYYGDKNATDVVVLMGSGVETAKDTVEFLNKNSGTKYGVLCVRLYRPFSSIDFLSKLPKTVKRIAVLDRTKESGSDGEPLYKDVVTTLFVNNRADIQIVGGRYGLGGKEFTPRMVKAVFDNLKTELKNNFTVGINDDITHTSLSIDNSFDIDDTYFSCKFYGLGSDGTVSANKNSIKIIGSNTDLNVQGYFEYDSKKSGSVTISHLRSSKNHTNSPYLITNADFVACHNINFIGKYDMEDDLKMNGTFLLNSPYDKEELQKVLPNKFFETLKKKKARLFIVDANKVAEDAGLLKRINVVMQACFFKTTNIIDYAKVEKLLIDAASKTYARKGQDIVDANVRAIKSATENLVEIDLSTISLKNEKTKTENLDDYDKNFIKVIEHKKGDNLPVSAFDARGIVPTNTSRYEKRGISIESPKWLSENCIQCNMCSAVCPHGAIRPALVKDDDLTLAPATFGTIPATGIPGYHFRMQINVADCTGCGNCVRVCPAIRKALVMTNSVDLAKAEKENYNFAKEIENPKTIFKENTLKGSQFNKPYFEFSGACAGCGETPYVKLVSQLFGKRLIVANATGCSSIYSGSAPTCPYAKDKNGFGPAFASSLFEDNAEFGYGIYLAKKNAREKLKNDAEKFVDDKNNDKELVSLLKEWLMNFDNGEQSFQLSKKIAPLLKNTSLSSQEKSLTKECVFIIGGDGWAYDIGFGGLDHVLASGENVNILVLDTEVYSNTGGQMSKATQLSATAKFASSGKRTPKKDLGMIAMTYKNVYVAQIGLGANLNQSVKALSEAESYDGPSLIIAYAPCINHGINMSGAQEEIKKAVECGYWHLYRYDPRNFAEKKNPLMLDSAKPTKNYEDFLKGESRFTALEKISPELAEKLFEESKKVAEEKYQTLLKLSQEKIE
ncbi:MAG: pyruvate:ferredoxin (flavodoxin) oxidoreductase, partial [Clostridia bacterium]|nr:pyruvate:ferredoxin (flavodoxin) oxidoreductase [Clostridia bacterium]